MFQQCTAASELSKETEVLVDCTDVIGKMLASKPIHIVEQGKIDLTTRKVFNRNFASDSSVDGEQCVLTTCEGHASPVKMRQIDL